MGVILPLTENNTTSAIGIIGDGYTAAVLVYHLIKAGISPQKITVFGHGKLGQGRAYGTEHKDFRLNVRAELMQVDESKPNDFKIWAEKNINDPEAKTDAGDFFRRCDFARYVTEKIKQCLEGRDLRQIKTQITSVEFSGEDWRLTDESGDVHLCRQVVLATGNPPSEAFFDIPQNLKDKVNLSPWNGKGFAQVDASDHVAIIGGGLTGLDLVTALSRKEFNGSVSLITPGGHLPPQQLFWDIREAEKNKTQLWSNGNSARWFARVFLKTIDLSKLDDVSEQEKFEALRLDINVYWRQLSLRDRNRLLKRFGWIWQKLRYRATPQAHQAMARLSSEKRFDLVSGRVTGLTEKQGKVNLEIEGGGNVIADHVFLATGRGKDRLIQQLCADGIVKGLFQTDDLHRVVTNNENRSLYALGPPTMMSQGDVFGASTISRMASDLAEHLEECLHG